MSDTSDYGAIRQDVMRFMRQQIRQLAAEGLPATEIVTRLDRNLTATEQEMLRLIAAQEVASAKRTRVADALRRQQSG